jgi:hypothetical protein
MVMRWSADGFDNPPNARIEGLAAVRSVVVGRTRTLPFLVTPDQLALVTARRWC